MQVVNGLIPRRDRAVVQLNIDRLNAIFAGDPITQLDVVPSGGGSGYRLAPNAEQLVVDRVLELRSHEVGLSSGASLAPTTRLAIGFFGVALPLPTVRPAPSVDDLGPLPRIEPVTAEPQPKPVKPPRKPRGWSTDGIRSMGED